MTQKITRGSKEWEDVCHYTIEKFMEHPRAEELVLNGQAMRFMSGMIHRSFHSSSSPYHTIYRQKGKMHSLPSKVEDERVESEYDYDTDLVLEAIEGILEEMEAENQEQWYQARLFRMYLDEPNYSELSRRTNIPRTSISQAVQDCKEHILKQLKDRNINFEL